MFPFFTLSSEYRSNLFRQIHEIVFYGKGGYSWNDVYNMPIWLRRYTHNEINDFYVKEKEQIEKSMGKETISANTDPEKLKPLPKVNVPDFVSKIKNAKNKRS